MNMSAGLTLPLSTNSPNGDLKNENEQVPCKITLLKQPTPTYSASRESAAQWRVIALTTTNLTQLKREGGPTS
ncbi:hypothetical protein [Burkholderia cenocepacia]|uniref:Type VI secretion system baseplate subunit TssF n=1 Tax=Burkholderia cenocepacia TaxID=95486 RepID=A0ABD4U4E2_9BURK|nr:hypothetical protein [Burkholderia cenocepacia]MCW3694381.1 type VI secretion system baseplate subunit TssF [Burkholderia cenocepacia]MCW3702392.1 type VI secretion system baseplate subunit TssF [Burkholderia cenocepacia]MCW3709663.1 type VI secretion system baseplate subunit TssF [Burkholderia cenocepacia]MCW3718336.1 type VI secretion system baseplate subunit TssF [Burkholderia cenocepacia]MCW3726531.1 type VI secretion system baseplate subunit TssF [Burkholderia cenocepacia]